MIYNDDIDDDIDVNDDRNDDNGDDDEVDSNGDDDDTKFKDPNVFVVERAVDKRTKVSMLISTMQLVSYLYRGASLSIYCYGKAIPRKMLLGWSLHM